jgi:hypothetical protein
MSWGVSNAADKGNTPKYNNAGAVWPPSYPFVTTQPHKRRMIRQTTKAATAVISLTGMLA